jgi:hypothetical protein
MHYHDSEDLKRLGEFKQLAPAEFSAFVDFDKIVGRDGCGAPPGGKVVSCTSNDSPVANLPFSTSRNCALFAVRTGKLSNGYIAKGRELCCADGSSTENNAGI